MSKLIKAKVQCQNWKKDNVHFQNFVLKGQANKALPKSAICWTHCKYFVPPDLI